MTRTLTVPLHLDAMILSSVKEVAAPNLDFERRPWLGTDSRGLMRDHFHESANVVSAIRHIPGTPSNRYLQKGTHLHWALPDALTRGTTRPTQGYVEHDGLWFPCTPNRWLVLRSGDGSPDAAWLVESDYVHPWGEGTQSVPYILQEQAMGGHPYRRVGRCIPLQPDADSVQNPRQNGDYLPDIDRPLTAVATGDPAFAAFYPSCHSVFGMFDTRDLSKQTNFEVIGWYSKNGGDPVATWLSFPDDHDNDFLAGVLSLDDVDPKGAHEIGGAKDVLRAREILFQQRTRWSLPKSDPASLVKCEGLLCYGKTTIHPATRSSRPPPVKGSVAVGATATEAMSALVSTNDNRADAQLEEQLEALRFGKEASDHHLDFSAKFAEARHTAGFNETGSRKVWTIRLHEAAIGNPVLPGTTNTNSASAQATLPPVVGHELNELNILQERFDDAGDVIASLRQRVYADWYCYMLATYRDDPEEDFSLDVDTLRDAVIPEGLRLLEFEVAKRGIYKEPREGTLAGLIATQLKRLKAALTAHNSSLAEDQKLDLTRVSGARYWQPSDPVIAIESAQALKPSERHGQDHRARDDNKLECAVSSIRTFPAHSFNVQKSKTFRDAAIANATPNFRSISDQNQGRDVWNPLFLEWTASFEAHLAGSNLTGTTRRYDENIISSQYELREDACELTPRQKSPVTSRPYTVTGRTLVAYHGPGLLKDALDTYAEHLATDDLKLPAGLAKVRRKLGSKKLKHALTQSLGGLTERLLMKRLEAQLPIADPLGFKADQDLAKQVRDAVGSLADLYSPEPHAPFMPLRAAQLVLGKGRVVDTFGQMVDWTPQTNKVHAANSYRIGAANRIMLPPRMAQPARLDFRWLSAQNDTVESNDHPATTPICGWVVPNDFDGNIMVYETAGMLLGMVDGNAIWHPAPANPEAPPGPGLIGNPHLSSFVTWLTTRNEKEFVETFLSIVDSALANIDPHDHAGQASQALLVGRPIAIARARIDLKLQGLPANDRSMTEMALRAHGMPPDDHGFRDITLPVRLGEHMQLNDGLVGYFLDRPESDAHSHLFAPQSNDSKHVGASKHVRIFDEASNVPLNIDMKFSDPPIDVTVLLDPRCPIHLTTGILPTKAISIPRDQFITQLRELKLMFNCMPVLTPPDTVQLPLPTEPGQSWSWMQLGSAGWTEVPAQPVLTYEALASAFPGQWLMRSDGAAEPVPDDGVMPEGSNIVTYAEVLWNRLIDHKWLDVTATGRGEILTRQKDQKADLGDGIDANEVERVLSKISISVRPAERHAIFAKRPIAREGWLQLAPRPMTKSASTVRRNPVPPASS